MERARNFDASGIKKEETPSRADFWLLPGAWNSLFSKTLWLLWLEREH